MVLWSPGYESQLWQLLSLIAWIKSSRHPTVLPHKTSGDNKKPVRYAREWINYVWELLERWTLQAGTNKAIAFSVLWQYTHSMTSLRRWQHLQPLLMVGLQPDPYWSTRKPFSFQVVSKSVRFLFPTSKEPFALFDYFLVPVFALSGALLISSTPDFS